MKKVTANSLYPKLNTLGRKMTKHARRMAIDPNDGKIVKSMEIMFCAGTTEN